MKKTSDKLDLTKDKIKKATFKLIKNCKEPSEVTSRAIAKEASVALAMINYCFGSSEALLFDVFQDLLNDAPNNNLRFFEIVYSDHSPKEILKQLTYIIIKLLLDNFSFTKAVAQYALLNCEDINGLPYIIAHYNNKKTEQECKLIAYELSSIMQLIVLRHKEIKEFCGINLNDDKDLKAYIDMQVDIFLPD